MYDYVVVGAGLAGSVMAERIASVFGKKVLVIEQRRHIGGNCYDRHSNNGVLIHQYGPHIFHTENQAVWKYVNRFEEWIPYQHKVVGYVGGQLVPIPFNLNSIEMIFPGSLSDRIKQALLNYFSFGQRVPILELRQTDDPALRILADYVYENIFLNYTVKQWGLPPDKIDPNVSGRVPVVVSRDDRYFTDCYQGVPKHGYFRMFENLLSDPKIKVMLNTDFREVIEYDAVQRTLRLFGNEFKGKLIFTGAVDELFDGRFGELPYQSTRFDFYDSADGYKQGHPVINYPNNYDFTRITEFKYLTGQRIDASTSVKEYPCRDSNKGDKTVKAYPIINEENLLLYGKYEEEAASYKQIILIGRLAQYKYYDMDDVIIESLNKFASLG